jgi:acyl carrier protein phosphodiesterase
MQTHNWLVKYASLEGLKDILTQMDFRAKNQSGMEHGVQDLLNHYEDYQNEFTLFFEEMQLFCHDWLVQNDVIK